MTQQNTKDMYLQPRTGFKPTLSLFKWSETVGALTTSSTAVTV